MQYVQRARVVQFLNVLDEIIYNVLILQLKAVLSKQVHNPEGLEDSQFMI